ncbi:hypothetical protein SESBI_44566 [Sesbania bispinosa]|nr:hypothetical protein SESBI_44566 [Sesbania bispinosa]
MGGLRESWCFCKGVSKSERMKVAICSGKGQAMATITNTSPNGVSGTGFLIHRNLLLTTHANLPSAVSARSSEIRLHNGVAATLVPQRFFITSSVLDLTIVGLDDADGESNALGQCPHYLKTCCKTNLNLGSVVYLLGYTEKQELTVGEGKHWEGNLDELNKPKLPLIRLMSTAPKSEHSCASFTRRQVFKSTEADNDCTSSSSNNITKTRDQGPSSAAVNNTAEEESLITNPNAAHIQGIPTPEIYESPRVTAVPLRRKESTQIQLLDINFPPRIAQPAAVLPQSSKELRRKSAENFAKEPSPENQLEGGQNQDRTPVAEVSSTGSVNGAAQSDVQSSSSPVEAPEMHNGYSSEGETMYSAETAESRNYTSPRELKFQQVRRSQSCVSYNRWNASQRSQVARGMMVENQKSFMHVKVYSQGASSHRSNDYFSPTVSSIMKRNSSEHPTKSRQTAFHSPSPRWMF